MKYYKYTLLRRRQISQELSWPTSYVWEEELSGLEWTDTENRWWQRC